MGYEEDRPKRKQDQALNLNVDWQPKWLCPVVGSAREKELKKYRHQMKETAFTVSRGFLRDLQKSDRSIDEYDFRAVIKNILERRGK
jgi:hypothetical protein